VDRRFGIQLSLAAVFAAAVGFSFGNRTPTSVPLASSEGVKDNQVQGARIRTSATDYGDTDFSHVRIDHLGELPFLQGYEFIKSASPEALKQWATDLENLPVGPHQRAAIKDFFRVLAQVDTRSAVDRALDLSTRDARAIATKAIQAAAPPEGFPAVAQLLANKRSEKGDPVDFTETWSSVDPISASKFVERDLDEADRTEGAMLVAENWAVHDPAAAKAWLNQLDPKYTKKSAYAGLVSGWIYSDEEGAIHYVIANAAEKRMSEAVTLVAKMLFTDSKDRARDFVNALPDDKARDKAVDEIAANASGRVLFQEPGDSLPADEAARWIITLSPDLQERHLGPVVAYWQGEHPEAVQAWLSTLPPETHDRAAAKGCLAWSWNRESVQGNLEMGFAIKDRQLREETLREFIAGVKSSEGGETKLAALKLSQAEKAELRRIADNL
jgi:hypothetical protein